MKRIFLTITSLLAVTVAGSAQTLRINNNTNCNVDINAHATDVSQCGSNATGLVAPGWITLSAHTSTLLTSASYNIISSTIPPPYYPNNIHLFGVTGGPVIIGTPCSGYGQSGTYTIVGCPGTWTATWTDLGGGNASVDLN